MPGSSPFVPGPGPKTFVKVAGGISLWTGLLANAAHGYIYEWAKDAHGYIYEWANAAHGYIYEWANDAHGYIYKWVQTMPTGGYRRARRSCRK